MHGQQNVKFFNSVPIIQKIFLYQKPTGLLFREILAPYYDHNTQRLHNIWRRIACFCNSKWSGSRSQQPLGLRRRSTAARLLQSWFRIPPVAWMFVCCECCVLSGRALCDGLITRPEESYDCGASLCVIKKPRTREGYIPARGLQNTNPEWVLASVEKKL